MNISQYITADTTNLVGYKVRQMYRLPNSEGEMSYAFIKPKTLVGTTEKFSKVKLGYTGTIVGYNKQDGTFSVLWDIHKEERSCINKRFIQMQKADEDCVYVD